MDTAKLRAYCKMCVPENWRHEENVGVGEDKILAGRALVARAHTSDALAITAFANAMPRLLDTIERLQKERDEARNEAHAWQKGAFEQVAEAKKDATEAIERALEENKALRVQLGDVQGRLWSAKQTRKDALAEVERLKGELENATGRSLLRNVVK